MHSMDDIYRRYARNVYQYLLSLTHDADISEEVTQETFYQAIRSIDSFNGSCRMTTWLCAIARNQLKAYYRKHPIMEEADGIEEKDNTSASAEDDMVSEEGRKEILKRIHLLKEPLREIMYLRIFGGLSFREIGDVFGKTENWARVTYYRSKEQLREELDRNEE